MAGHESTDFHKEISSITRKVKLAERRLNDFVVSIENISSEKLRKRYEQQMQYDETEQESQQHEKNQLSTRNKHLVELDKFRLNAETVRLKQLYHQHKIGTILPGWIATLEEAYHICQDSGHVNSTRWRSRVKAIFRKVTLEMMDDPLSSEGYLNISHLISTINCYTANALMRLIEDVRNNYVLHTAIVTTEANTSNSPSTTTNLTPNQNESMAHTLGYHSSQLQKLEELKSIDSTLYSSSKSSYSLMDSPLRTLRTSQDAHSSEGKPLTTRTITSYENTKLKSRSSISYRKYHRQCATASSSTQNNVNVIMNSSSTPHRIHSASNVPGAIGPQPSTLSDLSPVSFTGTYLPQLDSPSRSFAPSFSTVSSACMSSDINPEMLYPTARGAAEILLRQAAVAGDFWKAWEIYETVFDRSDNEETRGINKEQDGKSIVSMRDDNMDGSSNRLNHIDKRANIRSNSINRDKKPLKQHQEEEKNESSNSVNTSLMKSNHQIKSLKRSQDWGHRSRSGSSVTEKSKKFTHSKLMNKKVPKRIFKILLFAFKNTIPQNFEFAYLVFDALEKHGLSPDIHDYNILMEACVRDSRWRRCMLLLRDMRRLQGLSPNTHSYRILLNCCRHAIDEPAVIFETLRIEGIDHRYCYKAALINAHNRINKQVMTEQIFDVTNTLQGASFTAYPPGKTFHEGIRVPVETLSTTESQLIAIRESLSNTLSPTSPAKNAHGLSTESFESTMIRLLPYAVLPNNDMNFTQSSQEHTSNMLTTDLQLQLSNSSNFSSMSEVHDSNSISTVLNTRQDARRALTITERLNLYSMDSIDTSKPSHDRSQGDCHSGERQSHQTGTSIGKEEMIGSDEVCSERSSTTSDYNSKYERLGTMGISHPRNPTKTNDKQNNAGITHSVYTNSLSESMPEGALTDPNLVVNTTAVDQDRLRPISLSDRLHFESLKSFGSTRSEVGKDVLRNNRRTVLASQPKQKLLKHRHRRLPPVLSDNNNNRK